MQEARSDGRGRSAEVIHVCNIRTMGGLDEWRKDRILQQAKRTITNYNEQAVDHSEGGGGGESNAIEDDQPSKAELRSFGRSELKIKLRTILNVLYANANISRREKLGSEMIKLIFAKLRDETTFQDEPPAFRIGPQDTTARVAKRVKNLFKDVVKDYARDNIFNAHDAITLDNDGICRVVRELQDGSLTNTDTDVVGDAFEVFAESRLVGEKGEFFTPREVVKLAISLVDPHPRERVCDPACGSGGFLISAMKHVWTRMEQSKEWTSTNEKTFAMAKQQMASNFFYGIDKESDLVRITKAYMAIAGDGRSNIVHENSLKQLHDWSSKSRNTFADDDGSIEQFDCVITNPPYGSKIKIELETAQHFDLGHSWTIKNHMWAKGRAKRTDPYVLFIERCFQLCKDGGRLALVLPESVFHAPSRKHIRNWIAERATVTAIVDLPRNAFQPHCGAKTCVIVMTKGVPALEGHEVIMAAPQEIGHNHKGITLFRPGTSEIWNDFPRVHEELNDPHSKENQFVTSVPWTTVLERGNWVPRAYAGKTAKSTTRDPNKWISLGTLVEEGVIATWNGHGSPSSAEKGQGDIPYIKVRDIVNWELYKDPNSCVNEETYDRMTRNRPSINEGDILLVQRASDRIGTVAMASARDKKLVLTRELVTLRVQENDRGITPFWLLAQLSSREVQEQIKPLVFIDTTLTNIGERWKEIEVPIQTRKEIAEISAMAEYAIRMKWAAQDKAQELREKFGGMTT